VAGCGARLRWQILLVVSVYLWPPTLDGLEFGQINPFVFSALALALLELRREAWTRCGGWIGFAAAVKMSPAILLFSLLFARTRRGIVAFCVVLFIGLAVGVCSPRGIQIYDDCLRGISPLAKGARNWEIPENYSLARLLGYALEDLSATALMGVVAVLSLLLFGVMEVCIRHRSGEQIQRHFALTVIVMILASPIVWFHHLIWALVPLTVALVVSNRSGRGAVILVSLLLGLSLYLDVSYQLWFTGGFEANRALWVGPVVVVIPLVVVALVLLQSDRRNLERL
jgi:hypothetical protein